MWKNLFGNRGFRIWFFVTAAVFTVFLVLSLLMTTVFYSFLCTALGGERRIVSDDSSTDAIYLSDYESKRETYEAANLLNERVAEEGIVLLKNEGALPLAANSKVNVFGKNSVDIVYGGSGSGAGSTKDRKTLYESLDAANIAYNAELKEFYEDNSRSGEPRTPNPKIENSGEVDLSTGETPLALYDAAGVWQSCESPDISTALVVISRIGGEGFDLPRSESGHYLQLDANERALLRRIGEMSNIDDIIVIVNSSTSMELGFLDDPEQDGYQQKITGALWIGGPGNSGIMALGRVLNGETNPSGRLVDTYARDFTQDPTWENFGNNMLTERAGRNIFTGNQYMASQSESYPYYYVDYEEGIYVGYRYWETRGFTDGESWYRDHVVYPFGYGLSYSEFRWETDAAGLSASLGTSAFTVRVEVTHTSGPAGRDVVELYATPPYEPGGIEKPHKILVGFAKTPVLYPAEEEGDGKPHSCVVEITVDPYDIASYDYNDANGNGFKGYELEAGAYTFSVSRNAHEAVSQFTMTASSDLRYSSAEDSAVGADPTTGKTVVNRYDDADDQLTDVTVHGQTRKGLSRSDWTATWPTRRCERADRIVDTGFIAELERTDSLNPHITEYTRPRQANSAPERADIQLRSLNGEAYGTDRWEAFMDQLTPADMNRLISNGNFQSPGILYVGKPATLESDGPVGFVNFLDQAGRYYDTCSYASECVMAATWNVDLLRSVGRSIGNEGIWGNDKGDGTPYSGLYAPGVNIHRSPFGGRNFEYFSEDGFLSGTLAAAEIAGAREKGVYMYVKHFAVNDQETHRDRNGLVTWATEQSMREIYFRPFEKAVKVGKTTGVMSSFNRIGTVWAGGDYRLLTEILRDEWGFRGTVISDFNVNKYMNPRQMHYAGGDLNLTTMDDNRWTADPDNAADVRVLRQCAQNIMFTVANSCAINEEVSGYRLPVWTIILIVADVGVAVCLGVWGFFAVRGALKKSRMRTEEEDED